MNGPIAQLLLGEHVCDQERLDQLLIKADGTENKAHFGANAILGASLALARAGALTSKLPLYRYIGGSHAHLLPCAMMNIINGGAHADNMLDFQEFMIRPVGAEKFCREGVRWGANIFHTLKSLLKKEGHVTAVGDEGGFAPHLSSNEQALDLILRAIEKAGFRAGSQISLALDCAASEFFDKSSHRYIEKKKKERQEKFKETSCGTANRISGATQSQLSIDSIEDGLAEWDWEGWKMLTQRLGNKVQLVGDNIFVTNPHF